MLILAAAGADIRMGADRYSGCAMRAGAGAQHLFDRWRQPLPIRRELDDAGADVRPGNYQENTVQIGGLKFPRMPLNVSRRSQPLHHRQSARRDHRHSSSGAHQAVDLRRGNRPRTHHQAGPAVQFQKDGQHLHRLLLPASHMDGLHTLRLNNPRHSQPGQPAPARRALRLQRRARTRTIAAASARSGWFMSMGMSASSFQGTADEFPRNRRYSFLDHDLADHRPTNPKYPSFSTQIDGVPRSIDLDSCA